MESISGGKDQDLAIMASISTRQARPRMATRRDLDIAGAPMEEKEEEEEEAAVVVGLLAVGANGIVSSSISEGLGCPAVVLDLGDFLTGLDSGVGSETREKVVAMEMTKLNKLLL